MRLDDGDVRCIVTTRNASDVVQGRRQILAGTAPVVRPSRRWSGWKPDDETAGGIVIGAHLIPKVSVVMYTYVFGCLRHAAYDDC